MSEIMALHGPGSRLDGLHALRRNTPPPGTKERLEAGLERIHRLFHTAFARYVELLDAETPDSDLEASLAGLGGQAGSGDDREADYSGGWSGRTSDEEPLQGWTEGQSRAGRFGGGYAMDDDEHSLGSLGGTASTESYREVRGVCRMKSCESQVHWWRGAANDLEDASEDEGAACEDEGAATGDDEPDYDDEPSLGSVGGTAVSAGPQRGWSQGGCSDQELDHDGREPEDEGPNGDEGDYTVGVAE